MSGRKSGKKHRRKAGPRGTGRRRLLGRAALVLLGVVAVWLAWEAFTWPDVAALAHENPKTTAFIERYRSEQRAAGRDDGVSWQPVPYSRISPALKIAVLVGEDINFFSHKGFETGEIGNALEDAVREGKLPRGASTISQQLVKNLWLSPSRNPLRKLKEAMLTRQIEATLGKRRILELYLNVVELGPGVYGAEAASRRYFGRSAAGLNDHQAAQLAASLPRPGEWHPGVDTRGYREAVARIEGRAEKASGWISKEL